MGLSVDSTLDFAPIVGGTPGAPANGAKLWVYSDGTLHLRSVSQDKTVATVDQLGPSTWFDATAPPGSSPVATDTGLTGNTLLTGDYVIRTLDGEVFKCSSPTTFVDQGYSIRGAVGFFGDGSDGVVTLDGTVTVPWATLAGSTYTMTTDCFCASLTINSGVTLLPNNWRPFVSGPFVNNGTIGAAANAGLAAGGPGVATPSSFVINANGAGGAGGKTTGTASGQSAMGGASGAGGLGPSGAGGNGRTPSPYSTAAQFSRGAIQPTTIALANLSATLAPHGAPGGGGGGGDGTNLGGGGGAGGLMYVIFARSFVNNGTIIAAGGAGGTPTTGNCGGGGAGGGGIVLVYTLAPATMGTINVSGGAGGGHIGTGVSGGNGGNGWSQNVVLQ